VRSASVSGGVNESRGQPRVERTVPSSLLLLNDQVVENLPVDCTVTALLTRSHEVR
jgi:hypothetical protein